MDAPKTQDIQRVVITADGSSSLFSPHLNQHYHSSTGALTESEHIFINLGLRPMLYAAAPGRPLSVFEMGFGSGLNALLTWKLADQASQPVCYTGVEAYPVSREEAGKLNFGQVTGKDGLSLLHESPWGVDLPLSDYFTFRKEHTKLQAFHTDRSYDLVYFDAFSPDAQPELWTVEMFRKIASFTREGGVLVTYSSKGSIRRALAGAGFTVEKHPGPGRKREVVKAIKSFTSHTV